MQLKKPFVQLPLCFDAEALANEVRALPQSAWVPHATGFPGNDAVRLVTPGGQETDAFEGPMKPTENLGRCRYIMEIMSALGGVWGRSRLMGLGPGAEVPPHIDTHYHWRTHLRIHVPVLTNTAVEFTCGGETVHMAPGECWVFDSFRWHEVHNRSSEKRVHLVLDTVVTERLWDLIDAAERGVAAKRLKPGEATAPRLAFEQINAPKVMSPWEIRCHLAFVAGQTVPSPKRDEVLHRLDRFADGWAAIWAQVGAADIGAPAYRDLIARTRNELERIGASAVTLRNELELPFVIDQLIFINAVRVQQGPATSRAGAQRLAS